MVDKLFLVIHLAIFCWNMIIHIKIYVHPVSDNVMNSFTEHDSTGKLMY